jgi:hypothetical protein
VASAVESVQKIVIVDELRRHGKLVRGPLAIDGCIHPAQIEDHLSRSGNWFAGGEMPSAADYMMFFCLETFILRFPDLVGPKTREYVERVENRSAVLPKDVCSPTDEAFRSAYRRVSFTSKRI